MGKFLLDTHVVLWIAIAPSQISDRARAVLDSDTLKFVSIASAWEVAIKLSKNTQDKTILDLPGGLPEFYKMLDFNEFLTLPVKRP